MIRLIISAFCTKWNINWSYFTNQYCGFCNFNSWFI